jgi:hypothetical protein
MIRRFPQQRFGIPAGVLEPMIIWRILNKSSKIQHEFRADHYLKNSRQRSKIQPEVRADHDPKISPTKVQSPWSSEEFPDRGLESSRSLRAYDDPKNSPTEVQKSNKSSEPMMNWRIPNRGSDSIKSFRTDCWWWCKDFRVLTHHYWSELAQVC